MIKKMLPLLVIITLMAGCGHSHDAQDDHDHDHDEVKLFITAYNETFEVFAEADPFVQGVTSQILAHFTLLENFKPLTDARVTVSMVIGDRGIRHTLDKPFRPGVYPFSLQPEATGVARLFFDVEYEGAVYRLEGGRYRVYNNAHDALHAAEHFLPDHPTAIAFTKEHSWVIDFATAPVDEISMGTVIKTVGEVLPMQGDEMVLSAQSSGIVRFVNSNLFEGVSLQGGEVLLNVSGEALAENNATLRYREARSNYERAKADFERISTLAAENIASGRQLAEARNTYETAAATFENLSRNFSESGQVVRSPFAGTITQLWVINGQYVETGQPLARVSRQGQRVIRTEVQQRYAPFLQQLSGAHIRDTQGQVFTLEQLEGSFIARAGSVNAQTHLLPVVMRIRNIPNWVNGALLDVFLKTTAEQAVMAVPNTALVEEQGYFFVFVQIHPESFEKRQIRTGITDGIYTQVLDGLTQGERIVSRGALMVKMAAASGDIDPHSGHVH